MISIRLAVAVTAFAMGLAQACAQDFDLLRDARLAAIEGDHAKCAELSDSVRKLDGANWQPHQMHASCTAIDARTHIESLTPEEYEAKVTHAIEVLESLHKGPLIVMDTHRSQVRFMAIEMKKQLKIDLAAMRAKAN